VIYGGDRSNWITATLNVSVQRQCVGEAWLLIACPLTKKPIPPVADYYTGLENKRETNTK
jgi:hypothetical protein